MANASGTTGNHLIVQEFAGTTASSDTTQFRIWINGSLATLSYEAGSGGRVAFTGGKDFWVTMHDGMGNPTGLQLAQFHVYKGALTDQQRNDITAYLKSISGIV